MMWIFGLVAVLVGIVLVLAIGAAIVLAVIELTMRLVLALALAAAAGVAVGIAAQMAGADGAVTGVLALILAFLPALVVVSRWRSAAATPSDPQKPLVVDGQPSVPSDPLERAWEIGRTLAPHGALDNAQTASTRLLEIVDREGSVAPELIDYAVMLRHHVPALISETNELLVMAGSLERRRTVAALIADLQALGEGASALVARRGADVREKLAVRRARLFGHESAI